MKQVFNCQYFTKLFPISTRRGHSTCNVASSFQVNHYYESLELVLLCSKIYLQNCKFWFMLKVCWRESHPVQFLKAPQMTKIGILLCKRSVDMMQAHAKIHQKNKVTTTVLCKKHWNSPGNPRTILKVYPRRLILLYINMYDCQLKG